MRLRVKWVFIFCMRRVRRKRARVGTERIFKNKSVNFYEIWSGKRAERDESLSHRHNKIKNKLLISLCLFIFSINYKTVFLNFSHWKQFSSWVIKTKREKAFCRTSAISSQFQFYLKYLQTINYWFHCEHLNENDVDEIRWCESFWKSERENGRGKSVRLAQIDFRNVLSLIWNQFQ